MSWNGVFMAEVQKHECLYNKFCREYRNKELRNECWQKVAEKFDMTPMDAEKKFRNIRTSYGRFLKKRRTTAPIGSGQDFIPFAFENCEWLAVHIIHRGFDSTSSSENIKHLDSGSEDESSPVSVTMSNIEFMNFSGDYNDTAMSPSRVNDHKVSNERETNTSHEVPNEVQTVDLSNSANNKLKAEENSNHVISSVQNIDKSVESETAEIDLSRPLPLITKDSYTGYSKPTQNYSAANTPQCLKRRHSEVEDEDDLYCRSLVPRLKRLTPQAKAYVRIQMEQLLFHAEYSGQAPQIGVPVSYNFTEKMHNVQSSSFLNGRQIEHAGNR